MKVINVDKIFLNARKKFLFLSVFVVSIIGFMYGLMVGLSADLPTADAAMVEDFSSEEISNYVQEHGIINEFSVTPIAREMYIDKKPYFFATVEGTGDIQLICDKQTAKWKERSFDVGTKCTEERGVIVFREGDNVSFGQLMLFKQDASKINGYYSKRKNLIVDEGEISLGYYDKLPHFEGFEQGIVYITRDQKFPTYITTLSASGYVEEISSKLKSLFDNQGWSNITSNDVGLNELRYVKDEIDASLIFTKAKDGDGKSTILLVAKIK